MTNQENNQRKRSGTQPSSARIIGGAPTNILSEIWEKPFGKAVVIGGGTIGLLYFSGVLFHALAYMRRGYNDFRNSGNKQ